MLCCVVTTDGTIGEGLGECVWVGGDEEVGDVEGEEGRRSRMRIDQPWGASGDTRYGCCVVHGGVPGMPEEPDVLPVSDEFGVEDVVIDF